MTTHHIHYARTAAQNWNVTTTNYFFFGWLCSVCMRSSHVGCEIPFFFQISRVLIILRKLCTVASCVDYASERMRVNGRDRNWNSVRARERGGEASDEKGEGGDSTLPITHSHVQRTFVLLFIMITMYYSVLFWCMYYIHIFLIFPFDFYSLFDLFLFFYSRLRTIYACIFCVFYHQEQQEGEVARWVRPK